MTRPDRGGPFVLLVRNFFNGLFESDLLPDHIDIRQSLIYIGVLFLTPSLGMSFVPFFGAFRPSGRILAQAQRDGIVEQLLARREQLSWGYELLFVIYAMTVVGFITVIVWDRAYPDRRDVMVLGTLPVRDQTVFGAKLAALILFVVGFVAAVSLPLGRRDGARR